MPRLLHQILTKSAAKSPDAIALSLKQESLSYAELVARVEFLADWLLREGLYPGARVAVYLPKQFETVISFFATSMAGGVMVPVNPLLKAAQVGYILHDCSVDTLITSQARLKQLAKVPQLLENIRQIIVVDGDSTPAAQTVALWHEIVTPGAHQQAVARPEIISKDVAAILYTSGSTGNPKGVVLSHNNMVAGARSVAEYLDNQPQDRLLAVLPFSFDYGLSQLTTAFLCGASVVLMEYLFPKDVIRAVEQYQITGLAAVPPLWVQLAELEWPEAAKNSLRYFTNSGGAMPKATLDSLRKNLPSTSPFLMYGLTEAFRSTFLEPTQVEQRPASIGKAIPDAEIMVLNSQGKICAPGEPGELVHRGPHVAMGYWNAPEKTAARFKPLPSSITGILPEIAVWSGDTVISDDEGYLYFVGRQDDMIKSSGYRISPTEIEEIIYQYPEVLEVAAIGVAHPQLGQAVVLALKTADSFDERSLLKYCQQELPNFMQPKALELFTELPRNANGKIDRPQLSEKLAGLFSDQEDSSK